MSWIRTIGEAEAQWRLRQIYERIKDPSAGRVDNVLLTHSLHPEGLEAHWAVYRASMRGTPGLTAAEREMIAVVVSERNGCHY